MNDYGVQPTDMRPREPLAKLVFDAMNAAGLIQADVARITGLASQHVSQIIERRTAYKANRLPEPKTMQALAKLPGLSILDITRAARASAGIDEAPTEPAAMSSGLRRNVHNVVDEFPDERLASVLQVLLALRDFTRNGNHRR